MVDTTKCDHCGAEARRVITKEFDGRLLNFCCKGCLQVYEMLREEETPGSIKPGASTTEKP